MKMVKSLLLGSAAGLVAVAGAQAADLPVKAKPVQYVKICSLYGAGFYYIPGTDMCIKVGGWVRFEAGLGWNGSFTTGYAANNLNNRSTNDMHWRRRGYITADARDQTAYGTVRSYIAVGVVDNDVSDNAAIFNANRAFIQWAGFTFGQAQSFFDFYSNAAIGLTGTIDFIGSDSGDAGWKVAAYTAQFGNGWSGTISAEMARRTFVFNASGPLSLAGLANNYEGLKVPDVVGNLRVDQAWGSAQVMAAWHQVGATYYGAPTPFDTLGNPSIKSGFAVGGGVKLNAPMIGKGDYLQAQVTYANGASRYTKHAAGPFSDLIYKGNTFGFGLETDAVYGGTVAGSTASGLELTTSWALNAGYEHFWNPQWKTSLFGAYRAVSYNDRGNAMLCSDVGAGVGAGTAAVATAGCNMNWSMWGVGSRTQWNITKDFYMGVEVIYYDLKSAQTPTGTALLTANGTKPAGLYTVSDQNGWAFRFRVHRDFYP